MPTWLSAFQLKAPPVCWTYKGLISSPYIFQGWTQTGPLCCWKPYLEAGWCKSHLR